MISRARQRGQQSLQSIRYLSSSRSRGPTRSVSFAFWCPLLVLLVLLWLVFMTGADLRFMFAATPFSDANFDKAVLQEKNFSAVSIPDVDQYTKKRPQKDLISFFIVLRETSAHAYKLAHGEHLLRGTVAHASRTSPASRIIILHNQRARFHDIVGELLGGLSKDFPMVEVHPISSGFVSSDRTAWFTRTCNRARYGNGLRSAEEENGSRSTLCSSQKLKRYMHVLDFVDSIGLSERAAIEPIVGPFIILDVGTLLFLDGNEGRRHFEQLLEKVNSSRPVITSLEGLGPDCSIELDGYDKHLLNVDDLAAGKKKQRNKREKKKDKNKEAKSKAQSQKGKKDEMEKHKYRRKIRQLRDDRTINGAMESLDTDKRYFAPSPPLLHQAAPLLFTTRDGLAALLGATARALAEDLKVNTPTTAAWWNDPPVVFQDYHAADAVPEVANVERESIFSGAAWARHLSTHRSFARSHGRHLVLDESKELHRSIETKLRQSSNFATTPRSLSLIAASVISRCHQPQQPQQKFKQMEVPQRHYGKFGAGGGYVESDLFVDDNDIDVMDVLEERFRRFLGFFVYHMMHPQPLDEASQISPTMKDAMARKAKGLKHLHEGNPFFTDPSPSVQGKKVREWTTRNRASHEKVQRMSIVRTRHKRAVLPPESIWVGEGESRQSKSAPALKDAPLLSEQPRFDSSVWSCVLSARPLPPVPLSASTPRAPAFLSSLAQNNNSNGGTPNGCSRLRPVFVCDLIEARHLVFNGSNDADILARRRHGEKLRKTRLRRVWPVAALPLTHALVSQAAGDAFLEKSFYHGRTGNDLTVDDDDATVEEAAERDRDTLLESVQLPADLEERVSSTHEGRLITSRFDLSRSRKWGGASRKKSQRTDDAVETGNDSNHNGESSAHSFQRSSTKSRETEEDTQEIIRRFLHGHEDGCGL